MDKDKILNLVGDFTWCFSELFFVETEIGNFIWSDPDYNGDNTFTKTDLTWRQFIKSIDLSFGRDKGKHLIKSYCGDEIIIK